jgi:8-oxo-dGTP pyrophosphatase MutT (NUDIX family)
VALTVITCGGSTLIGRRQDGTPVWGFIGGSAEGDEEPERTAVREVAEETGLLVTAGGILGHRTHPLTDVRVAYVSAWPTRGTEARARPGSGLLEVRWVDIPEAIRVMPGMYEPARRYLTTRHRWYTANSGNTPQQ